jgi:hypothetical protein
MNQTIKIYKVNQDHFKLDKSSPNPVIIAKILNLATAKFRKQKQFFFDDIPKLKIDHLTYYLYVNNFPEKKSDWSIFLPEQLTSSLEFEVTDISILLFIDDGDDIFVVVGGKGFQLILPYIDHSFGLSVVSKILNPEKDLISSINSRGITGTRSGLSEQFRNEFKMMDFVRFGKVPTEIHLTLSEEISNLHFNFLQNRDKINERIKIYAGKSFKIKKNVNFGTLHKVIIELGYIREIAPNDYLSTYIEIKHRKKIEEQLNPLLLRSIYDDLSNIDNTAGDGEKRFKFDFSHPDKLAKFYEADYYILKEKTGERSYTDFAEVENKEDIYKIALKRVIKLGKHLDYYHFRSYIQGVRVVSYSDKKLSTSASFLFHFTSEFMFDNQPVFLVDKKWYTLKKSFVEDLEFECVQTIKSYKLPSHILDLPWDKTQIRKKEAEYNLEYDHRENYLVLDTFTPDGVELCDILYIENDIIYLIHVKYGFDASLRELTNQVTLAARRLYEDKKSGSNTYLSKVYNRVVLSGRSTMSYSEEEFILLFDKKIVFVFAFASQLKDNYPVENHIKKYKSNIARYSLVQCSQDMKTFMFDLNICQIKRE